MTRGTIQREHIYVRGNCEADACKETDTLIYECGDKLFCAEHTRQYARQNPPQPVCDRCGAQRNVVRDPGHRRNEYLCFRCHEADGFMPSDSVTGRTIKNLMQPILNRVKLECYAKNKGTECDGSLKPRSAWGGKILCNKHGHKPPKK